MGTHFPSAPPPTPLPIAIQAKFWWLNELTYKVWKSLVSSEAPLHWRAERKKEVHCTIIGIHSYQTLASASWIFWQCNPELWDFKKAESTNDTSLMLSSQLLLKYWLVCLSSSWQDWLSLPLVCGCGLVGLWQTLLQTKSLQSISSWVS